jgi:hypothetical protein
MSEVSLFVDPSLSGKPLAPPPIGQGNKAPKPRPAAKPRLSQRPPSRTSRPTRNCGKLWSARGDA